MDSWYYATADRQRHGPVQAEQLRALARDGAIDADTLVWREGFEQWRTLADAAAELGIAPLPAATLPSAPPPHDPYRVAPAAVAPQAPVFRPQVEFVPNHLVWAILSTLFCCWPLGVVAIVYATRVDARRAGGDVAGAWDASRKARLWAMWSALSVLILFAGIMLLAAIDGAFK